MNTFFNDFEKINLSSWKEKIISDLKGKPLELLNINNDIEGFSFNSVQGNTDFLIQFSDSRKNNDWYNGVWIEVDNETEANKKALQSLMSGSNFIQFKASRNNINWDIVLNNIQLEHIKTQIFTPFISDFHKLFKQDHIHFCYDKFEDKLDYSEWEIITENLKRKQKPTLVVNSYQIQDSGANSSQEIAFCLGVGHQYLVDLMKAGLTIDESAACISFNIGIGNDYFNEIAKIQSLKLLWKNIIQKYNPHHNCSSYCSINATIGLLNKSNKDPHTNLLRQTTESMAAINGGIDSLVIIPHDYESNNTELSNRMARNIPLVLKEESYLDKVVQPLDGSYSVQNLVQILSKISWSRFVDLENTGGIYSDWKNLKNEINITRSKRIESLNSKETTLIGVNCYLNPDEVSSNSENGNNTYCGLEKLRLEVEFNTVNND